jgi:hypothetical protein
VGKKEKDNGGGSNGKEQVHRFSAFLQMPKFIMFRTGEGDRKV